MLFQPAGEVYGPSRQGQWCMIKIRAIFSSPRGALTHAQKAWEQAAILEQPSWECWSSEDTSSTHITLPSIISKYWCGFSTWKDALMLTVIIPGGFSSSALTGNASLAPRTRTQLPLLHAAAIINPLTPRIMGAGATQRPRRVMRSVYFNKAGRTINFLDLIY